MHAVEYQTEGGKIELTRDNEVSRAVGYDGQKNDQDSSPAIWGMCCHTPPGAVHALLPLALFAHLCKLCVGRLVMLTVGTAVKPRDDAIRLVDATLSK
jgi:hypothetical protein